MNDIRSQMEVTFSMIKPDATERNISGEINAMIEKAGFKIIAQKRIKFTKCQARKFYYEHKDKPFYNDLCDFISSGPVVIQVITKDNAVEDYRKLMGATDPQKADEGTIRKKYGISIDQNSVHGSDSIESAKREIQFFFSRVEILDECCCL